MADERLIRSMRMIDGPSAPRQAFVEDLHAQLSAELGFSAPASPRAAPAARRSRTGWRSALALVAAAALVAGGLFAAGIIGRSTPVPPTTSPSPTASARSSPTASPATAASASASPAPPASPASAPTLLALRGDGRVVFEQIDVARGGVTRLRALVSETEAPELLPGVPGVQDTPAWSDDGTRLAFSGYDPFDGTSQPAIWESDAEGSAPRRLDTGCSPPTCLGDTDPAFSPDATRLAFVRTGRAAGSATRTSVIAVLDLRTGSVVELESTRTDTGSRSHRHPRWSPDGSQIAFGTTNWGSDGFGSGSVVSIIGPDGTGLRQVTDPGMRAGDPDWAADGSVILVSSEPIKSFLGQLGWDPSSMHIYSIRPDGSDIRQLDTGGNVGAASWSADGTQIVYVQHKGIGAALGPLDIMVMERDGSDVRPVSGSIACCRWYPVQQPTP